MVPDEDAESYDAVCSRRRFAAIAACTGATALAGCSDSVDDSERPEKPSDGIVPLGGVRAGERIAFEVRSSDEPVEGADVAIDRRDVGVTDADGRVTVELPREVRFTVTASWDDRVRLVETFSADGGGGHAGNVDVWFDTAQTGHPIESLQYNPHVAEGRTHAMHGVFEPYTWFDRERAEFLPALFVHWEHREDRMVAFLREDVTWEDGEPVDAEAIAFQWDVLLDAEHPAAELLTDVTASGDYEVSFHYEPETNGRIVEHAVLHERADHPPADWEPVRDGELEPTELSIETPTSSGPLTLTRTTDRFHEYAVRDGLDGVDDHPEGAGYNWHGYRLRHPAGSQSAHQMFINQELDGIHSLFASDAVLQRFPDSVEEIRIPSTFGMGVWFNHDREPWSNRQVRQAVAHSLDLEQVLSVFGRDKKIHHDAQTGLAAAAAEDYLGSRTPEGFEQYGDEDPAALVEDAGYDLGEISMEFVVPAGWSDWILMASEISDQLDAAGWDVELNTLGGAYWGRRTPGGDFDVIAMQHGEAPRHAHPYFSLRYQLLAGEDSPAAVASYEPPADVDVEGLLAELATTQERGEQEAIVRELASVVNRDLPYVHVAQKYEQSFVDREHWAFPEDHPLLRVRWPIWALPRSDEFLDAWDTNAAGLLKANGRTSTPRMDDSGRL